MTTSINPEMRSPMRSVRSLKWLAVALAVAACDTEVINPGPVQDEFLADRAAGAALDGPELVGEMAGRGTPTQWTVGGSGA